MRTPLLLIVVVSVLALAGTATAAVWTPGTNYMISEKNADDWLEQAFDSAYCDGIPRFGHRGRFPYEEFVVFDCAIERDGYGYCPDARVKAVKGTRVGSYKLKMVRLGDCYSS